MRRHVPNRLPASCARRCAALAAARPRARSRRATDADFVAREGGVRSRRPARARRARAGALRARARALRRVTGSSSRGSTTPTDAESQPFLPAWPKTPLADRLRVEWLKALGKRGDWTGSPLDYPPADGRGHRARLLRRPVSLSARRRRGARRGKAAVVHRAVHARRVRTAVRRADRAEASCRVADRRARFRLADRSRQRAPRAGDRGGPAAATIGSRRARVRARRSRSVARRSRKGEFAWKTAPDASSRSTRSSARRARMRRGARARGRSGAAICPRPIAIYGNCAIAYHAARQLESDGRTSGSAKPACRAERRRSARGAYARRCALPRGPTCSRDRGDAAAEQQEPRGATGERARSLAHGPRATRRARSTRRSPARSSYYGLLRRGARRGDRSSPSEPLGSRCRGAGGVRRAPDVRRAVKLAQLDMRLESQREWTLRSCAGSTTTRCCSRPNTRGAQVSTTARSTRPSARRRGTISALRYLTPFRAEFAAAAREQGVDEALLLRHRAPGIALRCRHRVVRGRGRPDATDAADGALGREAD